MPHIDGFSFRSLKRCRYSPFYIAGDTRGFKPSFIQFKLKLLTLLGSCGLPSMYSVRGLARLERSLYQCRVVFAVGLLQMTQYGSISIVGSSSLPHMSHWSPWAFRSRIRAFAFHKPIRQEPLIMFAVKHLGFLLENVTVFLDFAASSEQTACGLGFQCLCNYQMRLPIDGRGQRRGHDCDQLTL